MRSSSGVVGQTAGVMRCGLGWLCPVCSATIRTRRADLLASGLDRWIAAGGSVVMVTLTLPHNVHDSLETSLAALLDGWKALRKHPYTRRLLKSLGLAGFVRSAEITYSFDNGWHPHLHVLLILDRRLSEAEAGTIETVLFPIWERAIVKLGRRAPERFIGLDVRIGDGAAGDYVLKVQDGFDAAAELVLSDLKKGRRSSLTPFNLLEMAGGRDPRAVVLWHEYERTTAGRRFFQTSVGLWKLLGEEEVSDDELLEADDQGEAVIALYPPVWRAWCDLDGDDYGLGLAIQEGPYPVLQFLRDAGVSLDLLLRHTQVIP